MWKDYCTRLKERRRGMGAPKNEDLLYDYIARTNPHIYQPRAPKHMKHQQQQFIFSGYLCPPVAAPDLMDDTEFNSETQIIWSPLFEGNELKSLGAATAPVPCPELPTGWKTAEQKLSEINGSPNPDPDPNPNPDPESNLVMSSCSSNSAPDPEDDQPTVWTSAKCLLHMKDIVEEGCEPGSRAVEESLLEFTGDHHLQAHQQHQAMESSACGFEEESHNNSEEVESVKKPNLETSIDDSKYHSCDGSVSSGGIGRGKLNKRECYKEDVLLSEIKSPESCGARCCRNEQGFSRNKELRNPVASGAHPRKSFSPEKGGRVVRSSEKAPKRGEKGKEHCTVRAPRVWNSSFTRGGGATQRPRVKEEVVRNKHTSTINNNSTEKKHHWCLHRANPGPPVMAEVEVTSAGSTTVEVEQTGLLRARDQELISTLAKMNTKELKSLQCSSAIIRHNLGVLREDVKGLLVCLDDRRVSWWKIFNDFVVAAGLVSGAFGLRSVIDMLKRTVRYGGALSRITITNKQERLALAAIVLTVGARLGNQIWRQQGNSSCSREMKLREQLSRINERVSLMSGLTTTESHQQAAAATDSE